MRRVSGLGRGLVPDQRRPRPPPALHLRQAGLTHLRGTLPNNSHVLLSNSSLFLGGGSRGVPEPPCASAPAGAEPAAADAGQAAVPAEVHVQRAQAGHVALLPGARPVLSADAQGERPGELKN